MMIKARMTPARVIESKAMTTLIVVAIFRWRLISASVSGNWMCRLIGVVPLYALKRLNHQFL